MVTQPRRPGERVSFSTRRALPGVDHLNAELTAAEKEALSRDVVAQCVQKLIQQGKFRVAVIRSNCKPGPASLQEVPCTRENLQRSTLRIALNECWFVVDHLHELVEREDRNPICSLRGFERYAALPRI